MYNTNYNQRYYLTNLANKLIRHCKSTNEYPWNENSDPQTSEGHVITNYHGSETAVPTSE